MGVVYEATQLALERTVALKVISVGLDSDPVFLKRFRREGQAQGMLDHPHVVPVHEAGETEFGLFLAMRLVRGPTLKQMIVAGELDPARSLRILKAVADALDTAHRAGMVHRDVKPQNILVGERDHPYLADFGLTHAAGATSLTDTGMLVGTFDYISPEQVQGEAATAASDIYAFAAVLYECLVGEVPYPKDSRPAVMYAHLSAPPPRVTDRRPQLPGALDEVIARGLAKSPESRPETATVLVEEAERAFDGITRRSDPAPPTASPTEAARAPSEPTQVVGGPTRAAPPPRARRRLRDFASLGLVLLAMAVAGFLIGRTGDGEPPAQRAPNTASTADFELGFGEFWRRTGAALKVPGVIGGQRLALEPTRGAGGLTAATTDATGPALLPQELIGALPAVPSADVVELAGMQALRYSGLRPRTGPTPVDVYAVPTDKGVATVTCHVPSPDTRDECASVASTLTLLGPNASGLGPDQEFAEGLRKALGRLNRERNGASRALERARRPARQADAAESLAQAYGRAAGAIRELRPSPRDAAANDRLAGALGRSRDAYSALGAAAERNSKRGYNRAAASVDRSGQGLRRAFSELRKLGYQPAE